MPDVNDPPEGLTVADLDAIGPPFAQRGGDLLYAVEPAPFDVDHGHVFVVRDGVIIGSVLFQSILARGYVVPVGAPIP